MEDQYAEEDKLEQISAQKRRMKQAEHRRIIDQMVAERKRRMKEDLLAEKEQAAERERLAKYRRAIIEQERQRILRENAVHLLGYLPKVIEQNIGHDL